MVVAVVVFVAAVVCVVTGSVVGGMPFDSVASVSGFLIDVFDPVLVRMGEVISSGK